MSDLKHIHLIAAKHILRYVRSSITYGLRYTSSSCEVVSLMGLDILPAVEYCYLDIQIQIGLAVQLTEKVPLVIASIWDQQ